MAFVSLDNKNRNVVPRWRDSHAAGRIAELESASSKAPPILDEREFQLRLAEFNQTRSIGSAAEVLNAAIVVNKLSETRDAAEYLLSQKIPENLLRVAKRIARPKSTPSTDQLTFPTTFDAKQRVRVLREDLRLYPRNPISWVDISREYTNMGQFRPALRAIRTALALAPEDRFVLRSAARLFLHLDDAEQAHDILIRARSAPTDPWLMAAELAIAPIAGREPEFVFEGRQALRGDFAKRHIAELTSALGTLELHAGKDKVARRLFREALVAPTENTVAQVSWAADRLPGFALDPKLFATPGSFEARAWNYYHIGIGLADGADTGSHDQWSLALQESWNWLNDQPFSTRPAVHGSFIASVLLDDYAEARRIADAGLDANPRDFTLLNNTAVALAKHGDVSQANEYFSKIDRTTLEPSEEIVFRATRGLLRFRSGDPVGGRAAYLEAVERATGQFSGLKARAAIFLAMEELRLGTDQAPATLSSALGFATERDDIISRLLARRSSRRIKMRERL